MFSFKSNSLFVKYLLSTVRSLVNHLTQEPLIGVVSFSKDVLGNFFLWGVVKDCSVELWYANNIFVHIKSSLARQEYPMLCDWSAFALAFFTRFGLIAYSDFQDILFRVITRFMKTIVKIIVVIMMGAHDVLRYIVPCGGERLALQSLMYHATGSIPPFRANPRLSLPSAMMLTLTMMLTSTMTMTLRMTMTMDALQQITFRKSKNALMWDYLSYS